MAVHGDYLKREVLPFTALVAMECTIVGINTLYKAATLRGMNYHVYMFYDYAVASLLLVPAPFFSLSSRLLPPLTSSILGKIVLLGFIGGLSQIMGFNGINYSSPTLASALSNLAPAFTFILAIIFRMEKFSIRKTSTQAKVLGTTVSILGACLVTLYKGPPVLKLLSSPQTNNWVIGGLFITSQNILVTLWYILLAHIMAEYPAEFTVVFIYNVCVCFMLAIVGLFTVRDLNAWRLKADIALAAILCSGVFSSLAINTVHTWALRLKGPVYVAMFKPLSIAIAVAMGVIFLGDILHLGSLIGAVILSLGFYTVMWGKVKEEIAEDYEFGKVPLLQRCKNELV